MTHGLGDTEALWITLLREYELTDQTVHMQRLANDFGSPVVLVSIVSQGKDLVERLTEYRPTAVEALRYPSPFLGHCYACQRFWVELAPTFSMCKEFLPGSLNDPTTVFQCGRYCWECLRKALSNESPQYNVGYPYSCPACHRPLPVWAIEMSLGPVVAKRCAL